VSHIVAERILPLLLLASAKSTSMFDSTSLSAQQHFRLSHQSRPGPPGTRSRYG
jgi:hypothetical protein